MKKLVFCFFLFSSFLCFSQEYSEVVVVEGKSTDALYASAREWFAVTFKSANHVLQMDDPVAGILLGKGISNVTITSGKYTVPVKMNFTIKISIKEGKYKYDFTNINVGNPPSSLDEYKSACTYEGAKRALKNAGMPNPKEKLIKKTMEANKVNYPLFVKEIDQIVASLKKSMNKMEDSC